jgi:superfamily II DNA helicase RecQ
VLDYAQESGRAGRDRLRSKAVIIVQEGEQRAAKDKQTEAEQQLVQAYVSIDKRATCWQVVLDRYLDRQETERVVCKEGEEKCNACKRADKVEEDKAEEDEEEEEASESSESVKSSKNSSSNKEEIDTAKAEQDKAQQDKARRVFK